MIKLPEVLAANQLLMQLGADDQMPSIAAKAIERSLELQERLDRALAYAEQAPPNSIHARNMARILDGSITIDDELNEVPEHGRPEPRRLKAVPSAALSPTKHASPRGKLKAGKGLTGRSTAQRLEIREWIAEQGFSIAPSGRIPQHYLDAYDEFQAQLREARKAERNRPAGGPDSLLP
jgi:hypothetical protein